MTNLPIIKITEAHTKFIKDGLLQGLNPGEINELITACAKIAAITHDRQNLMPLVSNLIALTSSYYDT